MPTARLYESDGTEQGDIDLEPSVFGIEPNTNAIYEAEKLYLANQRQGTVRTQTRSDVSYTGKKVFRQKGLGRARMGSYRSPSRVGGGRAFGPQPRDYPYTIPKKIRRLAIRSVLSSRAQDGSVVVIEDLKFDVPKTKQIDDSCTFSFGFADPGDAPASPSISQSTVAGRVGFHSCSRQQSLAQRRPASEAASRQ